MNIKRKKWDRSQILGLQTSEAMDDTQLRSDLAVIQSKLFHPLRLLSFCLAMCPALQEVYIT